MMSEKVKFTCSVCGVETSAIVGSTRATSKFCTKCYIANLAKKNAA